MIFANSNMTYKKTELRKLPLYGTVQVNLLLFDDVQYKR